MADTDIIVSQMPNASQVGNSDLVMLTQPNAQAETGYSTAKTTVGAVAAKIGNGIEFVTDLSRFNDKTLTGAINENKDSILALLPVDEASGGVANFETDVVLPLIDVKSAIVATREAGTPTPQSPKAISGVSAVSVVHCHKNLFQYDENRIAQAETSAQSTRAYYNLGFKNCTIAFSGSFKSGVTPDNTRLNIGKLNNGILTVLNDFIKEGTVNDRVATFGPDDTAVIMYTAESTIGFKTAIEKFDLQLEIGSTATAYEAYNGTTYTFALGQTVYGGELDVINGKLKITHRAFAFSGSETWSKSTNFFYLTAGTITETPIQENVIGSNGFTINPMTNGQVRLYPSYGINSQYLSMDSTSEDINGYLSNGIMFLYRLVTPIEVDLTPQAITPILGVNNVWSDTNGDTTVDYKLGIQKYIDKKIAEVQALVL